VIREGLERYVQEVTDKTFPAPENWFGMPDEEFDELKRLL
jgi:ketopantoate hydroxymethyltransferase